MAVSRFLLSGWELSGIVTVQSGEPFSIAVSGDRANLGGALHGAGDSGQRPDFIPGPGCSKPQAAVNPGQPYNYIKLQCFAIAPVDELGNLGRNAMRGPGLRDFDFSIFKNNNVLGERLKVQFRAEAFNIINHANYQTQFYVPFNSIGTPIPANTRLLPNTVTTSRQIQFGMKFIF
jgi:hypothetical protein